MGGHRVVVAGGNENRIGEVGERLVLRFNFL
jgi:hypothetical protein